MSDIVPRGIANNNPLNIRHSADHWQGMSGTQNDPSFVTFTTPVFGLRAAMKIIHNYGLNDTWAIISKWAPESENPTSAYAENVANHYGVGIHDPIDLSKENNMIKFIQGMIIQENGHPTANWIHKEEPFWYADLVYQAAWAALNSGS